MKEIEHHDARRPCLTERSAVTSSLSSLTMPQSERHETAGKLEIDGISVTFRSKITNYGFRRGGFHESEGLVFMRMRDVDKREVAWYGYHRLDILVALMAWCSAKCPD